ncbi:DUF7261 family protein [Halovivax limisalsi]|uniref:DUF7261 family protein n=1 Tax=Halovivax limisalsi TaxID=1453760 RepID=UPI001FFC4279|nr:hypothetical protein [Halovivax limisalsi]
MVRRTTDSARTDRGQLVLIGAITIAFILLGVVVVYNGVQYTETVNTGGADRSVEHVRTVEAELEAGIAVLIESAGGKSELDTALGEFESEYPNTTAHRQPAVVTLGNRSIDWPNETVTVDYRYDDGAISTSKTLTVNASEGSP